MMFSRSAAIFITVAAAVAASLAAATTPARARPARSPAAASRCRVVANVPVPSPGPLLADHSAGKVYVPAGYDHVSVISMRTDKVTGNILVSPSPTFMAADPADSTVYVNSLRGADGVNAIDTRTDHVVGFAPVPYTYALAVYAPDHTVYASSSNGSANGRGKVYAISTRTDKAFATIFVGQIINGVTADPQTGLVYVSITNDDNTRPGVIAVINPRTNRRIGRYPVPGDNAPYRMVLDPRTRSLYIVGTDSGTVSVFSTKTNRVTASINVGSASDEAIVPSLGKLFVSGGFDNSVSVINVRTNKVIATLHPKSQGPAFAVGADQATGTVFMADAGLPGALVVISARTDKIIATVPTGDRMDWIAVDPDTNTVYGANADSNTVTIIRSCP